MGPMLGPPRAGACARDVSDISGFYGRAANVPLWRGTRNGSENRHSGCANGVRHTRVNSDVPYP
ncbi:hypothetical protein Acsp04_49140 [Actinomadura sp. NBRC 104425]|nr:hypothetical protein Acsp04_49140 [Actinomadura sp. NBRC 104425]